MLQKRYCLLSSVILGSLLVLNTCTKNESPQVHESKTLNFYIDLQNKHDTTITFGDSALYRIKFKQLYGESRCKNLDCSTCPESRGECKALLCIYNIKGDSVTIQPGVSGCQLEEPDSLIFMSYMNYQKQGFHLKIGMKKMHPYPTQATYLPSSGTDFDAYIATLKIEKTIL